jgi:hypothetical protein
MYRVIEVASNDFGPSRVSGKQDIFAYISWLEMEMMLLFCHSVFTLSIKKSINPSTSTSIAT